jgi:hypothetical protein
VNSFIEKAVVLKEGGERGKGRKEEKPLTTRIIYKKGFVNRL